MVLQNEGVDQNTPRHPLKRGWGTILEAMKQEDYLDKTVLLGVNYANRDGGVVERRQYIGVIEAVDETEGIAIRLRNGEVFELPPAFGALEPAEPGEYTLQSTLEIVRNPDFLAILDVLW